jgi:predicted site-specific integrase-resolvase
MPTNDLPNSAAALSFQLGDEDLFLTKVETARYLRVSASTLERWEKLGIGPKPIRLETGRVRYRWPEVRKVAQGIEAA